MPCKSVPGKCLVLGGLQFSGGGSPIFRGGVGGVVEGGRVWLGGWLRGVAGEVKGGTPTFFFFFEFFFDFCFLWGYTPSPGPDTGIRSMFGRYASYWNAFLLDSVRFCSCDM